MTSILTTPVFGMRLTNSGMTKQTLPGVLAALARDEVEDFPALRPHQRHPWHAFTVQLAAMALHQAGVGDPPTTEAAWATGLRGLTSNWPDDTPWCLVSSPDQPAFMQAPVPGGTLAEFKSVITAPDALDMLVTSKNHDLKSQLMLDAEPQDWLFALISLQTMEGSMGALNYGISRMNKGHGSRPALGVLSGARQGALDATIRPGTRFVRDLRVLLRGRERILKENDLTPSAGLGLVWVRPWDGAGQIRFSDLDPFYIEICRRVRLEERAGALVARTAGSQKARIAAAELKGRTGDPWTPIEMTDGTGKGWAEPKALTITGEGFSYQKMTDLLLGKRYRAALAQEITDLDAEIGLAVLACGFARGQGRTEGYHERVVPISKRVVNLFRKHATDALAGWAEERVTEAGLLRGKILRPALFALLQDGPETVDFGKAVTAERADRFLDRLDTVIDATFLDDLWREAEQAEAGEEARKAMRHAWHRELAAVARELLSEAANAVPHASMRRYRARARAEGLFRGALYKFWPHLRPTKESSHDDA